jgi:hypothetical protein
MSDDRNLISPAQLDALRPLLRSPNVYTQRLVEHLDFLPEGGQRWRRDLQILIPESEVLSAAEDHWFIVSLGQFRRRRLPDFQVSDCSGRSLNLLTRLQHGHCLADFTIDQYLTDRERDMVELASLHAVGPAPKADVDAERLNVAYTDLYRPTFEMFTSVRRDLAPTTERRLVELLLLLDVDRDLAGERAALFMEDMTNVAKATQYLCWVRARPGSPVRLTATYTMPDPRPLPPDPGIQTGRFARLRANARTWSSELYAQLGLGPIPYELVTPANDHTASYYFTLEPPPETTIPYLDWGLENTIEQDGKEWVCAHDSVHLHNGTTLLAPDEEPEPRRKIPESKIYAFMQLDPADHKQVLFAAALNLIFVWLAEAGRLSIQIDSAATPWLAFVPAALVAYVAQQRRHYFAGSTRWIRAVIWGYLALNIIFLVSITFDVAGDGSFAARHGASDDMVSIAMATASIVVFWLFAFVGWPYEPLVTRCFEWLRSRLRPSSSKGPERTIHSYVRVARWYGNAAIATIAISLLAMAAILLSGNGPSNDRSPTPTAISGGTEARPPHDRH